MSNELDDLKLQVRLLPAEDRVALMEEILTSFDAPTRKAVDAAWAEEAEDRLKAYDEGKMDSFSMDEVRRSLGCR